MRVRTVAAAVVAFFVVTSVAEAQDQGGGGGVRIGMGGGMGGGMGRAGGPPPLPPDSLSAVVQLDQTQQGKYATLYNNFKTSSQPERDSLQAIMGRMRAAREGGDQTGMQKHMEATRKLRESLDGRQKAFNDAMKEMLTKEQWGKYEQWRADAQKKAAAERGARRDRQRPPAPRP